MDDYAPNLIDIWLAHLRKSGYRLTAPRRAVVEVVIDSQRALSPAEVFDLARTQYAAIGRVTIYRTLEKLEILGLIQRVHHPTGCHGYIASASGHQHLLICNHCGKAEYFSGDDLDELVARVEHNSGYAIHNHWLQLFGLCTKCQRAAATN